MTSHNLADEFSELAEEMGLVGEDGEPCRVEEEEGEEHEEHKDEGEEHHHELVGKFQGFCVCVCKVTYRGTLIPSKKRELIPIRENIVP